MLKKHHLGVLNTEHFVKNNHVVSVHQIILQSFHTKLNITLKNIQNKKNPSVKLLCGNIEQDESDIKILEGVEQC